MTRRTLSVHVRTALLAAGFLAAGLLSGCARLPFGTSSSARLRSLEQSVELSPDLRLRVYVAGDRNTADVFLTDLSDEELAAFTAPDSSWTEIDGQIVHVHMFLAPKAGQTPIETTAANATVRYAVLTQGQIGVYTGAGFLLPRGTAGDSHFGATLSNATVRLDRATPGFVDLLGPSRLELSFRATREPRTAAELRARIDALSRRAEAVAPAPTP